MVVSLLSPLLANENGSLHKDHLERPPNFCFQCVFDGIRMGIMFAWHLIHFVHPELIISQ